MCLEQRLPLHSDREEEVRGQRHSRAVARASVSHGDTLTHAHSENAKGNPQEERGVSLGSYVSRSQTFTECLTTHQTYTNSNQPTNPTMHNSHCL